MSRQYSFVTIGAACLAFAASAANAQVDGDAGRAAGDVSEAGRGVGAGRVGGPAEAAAGVTGGVRGLSDAEIGVGLQAALSRELEAPGVRSEVRNGVATLSGTVGSKAEKRRAEQIARRIDGVSRVRNDLVVGGATRATTSSR
jgi:hyperosmotically inducible periplasmic protein